MFELAGGAEVADVFLGGFRCDVKTLGDGEICAAVELGRKAVEEGLAEDGDCATCGIIVSAWELTEDVSGVLKQHTSHDERCAEIGVVADDDGLDGLAIHEAKRSDRC